MKRARLYLLVLLAQTSILFAQTTQQEMFDTPEKTAGVYYAYPSNNIVAYTLPPTNYEAF